MHAIAIAKSALDLRWDAPYRLLASLLAIAGAASLVLATSPLDVIARWAIWASAFEVASAVAEVEIWLVARPDALLATGLVLLIAGTFTAHRRGRGAATALIGASAFVQLGGWYLLWPAIASIILLTLWLTSAAVASRYFDPIDDPTHYFSSTVESLMHAFLWFILGPISWMGRAA